MCVLLHTATLQPAKDTFNKGHYKQPVTATAGAQRRTCPFRTVVLVLTLVALATLIFGAGGSVQWFSEVLSDLVLRMNSAVNVWPTAAAEGSRGASFLFPPVAFVRQGCE